MKPKKKFHLSNFVNYSDTGKPSFWRLHGYHFLNVTADRVLFVFIAQWQNWMFAKIFEKKMY